MTTPATTRARLAGLLVVAGLVGCAPEPSPPNVLLVVLDTVRTDHLSAYGYPWETTPRLDALARRGVLFEDCTAQASWTMPSMISLMTGLPIFTTIHRVPDEHPVLAEAFAAAGYRTGAAVANALLSSDAGFGRGVDSFAVRQAMTRQWKAADVTDQALDFLSQPDERPFFLWLHYLDPHNPYEPPEIPFRRDPAELFEPWEREGIRRAVESAPEDERRFLRWEEGDLAREIDRYDGELLYLDRELGRVLDALDASGRADATYVVVVGDHGETLFRRPEHPDRLAQTRQIREKRGERMRLSDYLKREHDSWLYEELVRTPFIVAGPGLPPGRRVEALVTNLDVLPTLLGLAGLPGGPGPGRDLSEVLRAGRPVPPAPWAPSLCSHAVSVRAADGRKLVVPTEAMVRRHGHAVQLFDLESDPNELTPLPLDAAGQALLERLRDAQRSDPFATYGGADLDPETIERMRELGYLR